jgi:hypothetical protein
MLRTVLLTWKVEPDADALPLTITPFQHIPAYLTIQQVGSLIAHSVFDAKWKCTGDALFPLICRLVSAVELVGDFAWSKTVQTFFSPGHEVDGSRGNSQDGAPDLWSS